MNSEEFTVTVKCCTNARKCSRTAIQNWRQSGTGKVLHAKYSRYMQQIAEDRACTGGGISRNRRTFYPPQFHCAPTGTISLVASPTTPATVSSRALRTITRATLSVPVKNPRKRSMSTPLSCTGLPRDGQSQRYAVFSDNPAHQLPDYFIAADNVTPKQHVDIQAAAQKWIDSSISKTANVPTDYPYEDFKSIYQYAYDKGSKRLYHLPLQSGGVPRCIGQRIRPGKHHLPIHPGRRSCR